MYTVSVRDHVMIAHSFRGDVFGPAQRLHGATYVVDVEFRRPDLDADGIVVDIGRASETLRRVLSELNFRNLDDVPAFAGRNTTTEFLARVVFDGIVVAIGGGELGSGAAAVESIRVTLHESHIASASFEGRVSPPAARNDSSGTHTPP
jgi:6-pyruvoyl-tetrahydropterin synthase